MEAGEITKYNIKTKIGIYLWIITVVLIISFGVFLTWRGDKDNVEYTWVDNLHPETVITHGHGLAVDVQDPSRLYIATHHGLLLLKNDRNLYRIGNSRDDYMGFSSHPTESNKLFTSGHRAKGGNIGVQISEDGGLTWTKISDGIDGPVDFHAMAISQANPSILYGWYEGSLQKSINSGYSWELAVADNLAQPISFVTDPLDENKLYALTIYGIFASEDQGNTWKDVFPGLRLNLVTTFAIHPKNPRTIIAFSKKLGLIITVDGGLNWSKLDESFDGNVPIFLSIARTNPEWIYALTLENKLYKSVDGGYSWTQIH